MAKHGQIVWYELMTSDVEAAKAFYTESIGWKTDTWGEADPSNPYVMWVAGESHVGGVMDVPEDAKAMGVGPHWLSYIKVDDADATVAKAKELGGVAHKAPFDIPKVGRISILADPQGAAFGILQSENDMPPVDKKSIGQIDWAELNTTDYEAGWKFYEGLFGWKHKDSFEMEPGAGADGTYFMFNDADAVTQGGMSNMAKKMGFPSHWLHYVTVDNMTAAIERIKKNGGKVLNGPMDIPGDDVIAQCVDPQGAAFAIYAAGKNR